ncbi:hypothetical protein H257_17915 [Aphanomyces astaci]|uniref:Uncharacterized protein n=1 Tax=Aphanomyces astaci TaxID=112090 RepID=W4FEJ9_APHAT|nr:hypothetical protein H257_17915 [Aphanomyces astaci]ETV65314.1 hypothetical protein H257_17915 [Aphanomyces astaci]RHZ01178.1 hypothetical protein DYB35_010011 [Aphanomyces astaci]RHZ12185.1 hypothetical protein DYB37_010398 [Aphanomyces astaci]RHZ20711.1 hypothetical protein DYB31_010782 [Aphanomyces astaci]RLO13289.1 hypothetical protein DYB28_003661 [Aphanomyces astaci]|eukprot:XP_009845180.1 hypothetical protein H257_17915 [Aphanomyces astaci]
MSIVSPVSATVVYTFDPTTSGGVAGTITTLVSASSTVITADLDVAKANWTALNAADGNCTNVTVTEYTWHIHTKWDNPGKASELTAGCSLAKTANHFDPDFACGPNSDNIKELKCANKTYGCNTTSYANVPGVCEKGDLSGKLGKMKAVSGKISATWTDKGNYPTVAEHKDTWNIVLHAVCGSATPRFVCANGKLLKDTVSSQPTTAATTQQPSSAISIKASLLATAGVLFLSAFL